MSAVVESHDPENQSEIGNYFVAAYPPFSVWDPRQNKAFLELLDEPAHAEPIGIYVHLPFCQKKCDYCYYLSYAGQTLGTVNNYLEMV
ncbi:MAG: hypothetical protein ACXWC8_18185, partial [Limisphaerales bacterium]